MRALIVITVVLLCGLQGVAQQALSSTSGRTERNSSQTASGAAYNMAEAITQLKSWRVSPLEGARYATPIDTLLQDYSQSVAIPSLQYGFTSAITGNFGAEGVNMNYMERPLPGQFHFADAIYPYITSVETTKFYNTRVPMTLVSYNTGGSKDQIQDRLRAVFNGNINRRAQVGANIDYLYSLGSYDNQAAKHLNFGVNGSYLGDRYQVMAIYNQFNSLNKENGGIEDDLYILDPEEVQGGSNRITTKTIPVNLQYAQSRVTGRQAWLNNKFRFGFHRVNEEDSTTVFVPVSQVFWTVNYYDFTHSFTDRAQDNGYFENTYISEATDDDTKNRNVRNIVGISLLEGFNRWAKFGLTAYAMHEYSWYKQTPVGESTIAAELGIERRHTEHSLFIGGRLAKERGSYIRYDADVRAGIGGAKAGELDLKGGAELRLKLRNDTASLRVFGAFTNLQPSYFLREYVSNHFAWKLDAGKTRRVRLGATLDIPNTRTNLTAAVENVQNLVYFGADALPVQHSGNVQVVGATLRQDLKLGILLWQNSLTYQTSTNDAVIPLPKFSVYSNLSVNFRIATLRVQLGVDCNYNTSYYALGYQPATMTFTNRRDFKVGNYPMMDAYINMKLSKVRFYVLCSHWNQGLFGGRNYFSTVHNPLNPRRFLFGLSVDFAN